MTDKIICKTCGAEYDTALVRCPFCGTAYAPAEEEEYMGKLEGIREDLAREKDRGETKIKKRMSSTACIVLAAVLIVLLLLSGMLWLSERAERNRSERQKEEFLQDQGIITQQEVTDQ